MKILKLYSSIFILGFFIQSVFAEPSYGSDTYFAALGTKFFKQCRLSEAEIEFNKALIVNSHNQTALTYLHKIYTCRNPGIVIQPDIGTYCPREFYNFSLEVLPDCSQCSYEWDFGDNTEPYPGVKQVHSFLLPSIYSIVITADDKNGAYQNDIYSKTLFNVSSGTQARFFAQTSYNGYTIDKPFAELISICQNDLVVFDSSNSLDPDKIITYHHWNFGDGSSATGMKVTHAYPKSGGYLVTLIVSDELQTPCGESIIQARVSVCQKPAAKMKIIPSYK